MSLFKCKMCGGALEINNETVVTCEYCGTQQTLPKLDDDRRANLYDRANHFRRNNEFDKAMGIYEQILNEDKTDAEAYWSLVLCRYGIEYVEDPTSHKRMPTVNRAQFTSIFDDDNYKSALAYADTLQKAVYEQEAKAINEIQKGILAISQKEEPFDVFICYKETDNNGRRTPDSVLANDLYHQLTQEGFKVFFSRITLEDKLGSAYEPYIFAALNSAKVMVVLGTKPEYFNAVWIKNEWSRFLSLIKNGAQKMLIPAYKDMDPYDLPEEFSHLQAQDMSKLGFMQDLIRGIKKILGADQPKPQTVVKETVVTSSANANIEPLLKRAFMFLEEGNWVSAGTYCDKVLDIDPECAQAYLGKLMSGRGIGNLEDLKNEKKPFDDDINYKRFMQFGDEKLKKTLIDYTNQIKKRCEEARIEAIYNKVSNDIKSMDALWAFEEAKETLEKIRNYKNSEALIVLCDKKITEFYAERERQENERIVQEKRDREKSKRNKKIFTCIIILIIGAIIAYEVIGALGIVNSIQEKFKAEKLRTANVGDYVLFGSYEQDNNISNGTEDIEWLVLEVNDSKLLVISKYALDCKPYDTSRTVDVTWESCSLRKWLNNDFVNTAFSADEKAMIPIVTISADENPTYNTNPGNATQDQMFLLSISEANKYFYSDSARQCKPTDYADPSGLYADDNCWWWLRSPGESQISAAYVTIGGSVDEFGWPVVDPEYHDGIPHVAVRPAMWIDLSAIS